MDSGNARTELYEQVMAGERALRFGLVGQRLGHSHSPQIHAELGSAPYERVEVPPERIGAFFAARRFAGLNVTIPYKKQAAAACDELSDAARRLGNANTLVVRPDGTLFGDNTDYYGFACELASCGVDLAGSTCVVLGDGGAAATVRAVLADAGASEVVTATRRGGEAPQVCDAQGRACVSRHLALARLNDPEYVEADAVRRRAAAIVNATPAGMYPHADDPVPIDLGLFPNLRCVCDLVYNPLATRLVQGARERGIAAAGGLLMLVAQAKRSSDRFLGIERPDDIVGAVHETMRAHLSCVSLIGMPGCGKTKAGRFLAEELGYEFVDVDDLIPHAAGMSIDEVFATQGEEAFRAYETACTAEALAQPGRVVATGGGVVTQPRNLPILRQNGPVVLLTRGLDPDDGEELACEGRPMSRQKGVERLRAERAPLYRAWADLEVGPSPDGPAFTAKEVARELHGRCGLPFNDVPRDRPMAALPKE